MCQHSSVAPVPDGIACVQLHRQRVLRYMRNTNNMPGQSETGQLVVQPAYIQTTTLLNPVPFRPARINTK
jgi:hypothetical protein